MIIQNIRRFEYCDKDDSQLEDFLRTEKKYKNRLSIGRNEDLVKSVFQELNNLGSDAFEQKISITRQVLRDFLFICEDFSDLFEVLKIDEKVKLVEILKFFPEIHKVFNLGIKVSGIFECLRSIINDPDLEFDYYQYICGFLGNVIKKEHLSFAGKVNVFKIFNELIKKNLLDFPDVKKLPKYREITNEKFMFMSQILENDLIMVEKYFELNYICANFSMFNKKAISGEQFSIVLSGLLSVDSQLVREHFGMTIIDYLAIIMRISSDSAKLNSLICIQRSVSSNKSTSFSFLIHDIFKLILDFLIFSPLEVSLEASNSLLALVACLETQSKPLLIKYKLIDAIFKKLQDKKLCEGILLNFIDILDILKEMLVQKVEVSFRNEIGVALVDASDEYEDKLRESARELQLELSKVYNS
jgi:hypothetical protein